MFNRTKPIVAFVAAATLAVLAGDVSAADTTGSNWGGGSSSGRVGGDDRQSQGGGDHWSNAVGNNPPRGWARPGSNSPYGQYGNEYDTNDPIGD